jgi:hypothetical protein
MAWGKQDATEVLGMEPEEFKTRMGKLDSIDGRLTEAQTKTDERFNQLFAKIDELKPRQAVVPEGDPDLNFLESPTRALEDRLSPLATETLDNSIALAHHEARNRFTKDFDRWGNDIIEVMKEAAPVQRKNPKTWEMAVMIVRGRHAGEIEKDGATDNFQYLEPVSAGVRPDPKSSDNLTQAQRLMVKKLSSVGPQGMTPEKYQNGAKRLDKARSARLGAFAGVSNA